MRDLSRISWYHRGLGMVVSRFAQSKGIGARRLMPHLMLYRLVCGCGVTMEQVGAASPRSGGTCSLPNLSISPSVNCNVQSTHPSVTRCTCMQHASAEITSYATLKSAKGRRRSNIKKRV